MKFCMRLFALGVVLGPVIACAGLPSGDFSTTQIPACEPIVSSDRILILAPHPDDEAIGCAGIIQQALAQKAPVSIVYFTNGDANELAFIVYEKRITFKKSEFLHMGRIRRDESVAAMRSLGLPRDRLIFLGYPDFGSFAILMSHWRNALPFRSLLTRATSVPYAENFSYGSPYVGESILKDLESVIQKSKPTKIFVSHPADTNGDHRALYLFLQVAVADLYKDQAAAPAIYPYLVHCVGWPAPRRYHPELSLTPPKAFQDSQVRWMQYVLTPQQLRAKHDLILRYKSQAESSAFYLLAFARGNELFGDYPAIELISTRGAHGDRPGMLPPSPIYDDKEVGPIADLNKLLEGEGYVTHQLDGENLVVTIHKSKRLKPGVGVVCYLFGYRHAVAFGAMPKIRIMAKAKKFRVFDGKKRIHPHGVSAVFSSNDITVTIPLGVLGEPDFILSSMKTYLGILPIETVSFRKIVIRK